MDLELHETLKELRQGQLNLVQSQARTEGWMEGVNKTLDAMNLLLGNVGDMRTDIARMKERDLHQDPDLAVLHTLVGRIETRISVLEKTETRQWIEGLAKFFAGSVGGTGLTYWLLR